MTETEDLQAQEIARVRDEIAALKKEKAFLDEVLDTLDVQIFALNAKTNEPLLVNKASEKLTGYSREELAGFDFETTPTLPEEERANYAQYLQRLLAGESPLRWENWAICKNGEWKRIAWNSALALDSEGLPQYLIASGIDVTELRQTEEALRKAKNQAESATLLKDKFVTLVSHDLKTPLVSLLAFLDILQTDPNIAWSGEPVEMLNEVEARCQQMLAMIESLLALNRFQMGKIQLNIMDIKARSFAQTLVADMGHWADAKKIVLKNELPESLHLAADQDLLSQVVRNLISNAIKFSNEGATISVYSPDGRALAVKDTGIGILPEFLPDLFKMDVETTTPGTAGELGNGFGLPLCKEIIDAHGGKIWAESEEGKGSTFYVELPKRG